jgi:hypothetical protein
MGEGGITTDMTKGQGKDHIIPSYPDCIHPIDVIQPKYPILYLKPFFSIEKT